METLSVLCICLMVWLCTVLGGLAIVLNFVVQDFNFRLVLDCKKKRGGNRW